MLRLKFAALDTSEGVFEGYGSVAGNIDLGGDMILPGAFKKTLADHAAGGTSPAMLWAHKLDEPVGRWIDLQEDAIGLYCRGVLNLDTEAGRRAQAHIAKGDVSGLSIGYRIPAGASDYSRDGLVHRIASVDLYEVSIVTIPMNPKARIRVESKSELESLLVSAGLAKEAAKRVAYGGWPALTKQPTQPNLAGLLDAVTKSAKRI